jgi:tetratricopeptide (TPR) repeat protein
VSGTDASAVALAARAATLAPEPLLARHQLLAGLATRLTDGYAASAPTLTRALRAYRAEERRLDWVCVAFNLAAMDLWDDQAWFELATGQAHLARSTGTLVFLPYALDYLAGFYIEAGEFSLADGLVSEAEGLGLGVRAETLPYMPLRLAAWRGHVSSALNLVEVMMRGARARGEGCAITAADHAIAVLYNGVGQYELALEAARKAAAADDIVTSSWALYELVEAASRCGQAKVARGAVDRLSERASASGTEWAKGTVARSRALVEYGGAAEELHRQIDRLPRQISDGGTPGPRSADVRRVAAPGEPEGRRAPAATRCVRHVRLDGRRWIRRPCSTRAAGHGREGAQAPRRYP